MLINSQWRSRAFSLAELVCIMIIISILASIATPRLGGVVAHRRAEAAAGRVVADLALARHWARQSSALQTVAFDTTKHIYAVPGMADPSHPGNSYAVDLGAEPYGAELDAVILNGGKQVEFDQFGTTDLATNGVIRLRVGKYIKTVTLDADTGRAEIQE